MKFIKKQVIKESVEEIKKEELTEVVDNKRTYDAFELYQIVKKALIEKLEYDITDEQAWDIENIFNSYANKETEEIYAKDVDKALEILCDRYQLSQEDLSIIEQEIMKAYFDYAKDRKDNYISDVDIFRDGIQDIEYKLNDLKNEITELKDKSTVIGEKIKPILEQLDPILNELKIEINNLYDINYTGLEKE